MAGLLRELWRFGLYLAYKMWAFQLNMRKFRRKMDFKGRHGLTHILIIELLAMNGLLRRICYFT